MAIISYSICPICFISKSNPIKEFDINDHSTWDKFPWSIPLTDFIKHGTVYECLMCGNTFSFLDLIGSSLIIDELKEKKIIKEKFNKYCYSICENENNEMKHRQSAIFFITDPNLLHDLEKLEVPGFKRHLEIQILVSKKMQESKEIEKNLEKTLELIEQAENNDELDNYNSCLLNKKDVFVLKQFEMIFGESIPEIDKIGGNTFGFRKNGNKIIDLSFHKKFWIFQPKKIYLSKEIKSLDLSYNGLTNLPEIMATTNLKKLNFHGNLLVSLPKSLGLQTGLTELNLSENRLDSFPEFIEQLTDLETLNLSKNEIKSLPKTIGKLINLKILDLEGVYSKSLPQSFLNLINLEELNLSSNGLKSFPISLINLINLKKLNLSKNKVKSISEDIENLSQLRELDVSFNALKSIPDQIGKLIQLNTLNLGYNNLKTLPESVGNLEQLKELNISFNKMKSLPQSIENLEQLNSLIAEGNPKRFIKSLK